MWQSSLFATIQLCHCNTKATADKLWVGVAMLQSTFNKTGSRPDLAWRLQFANPWYRPFLVIDKIPPLATLDAFIGKSFIWVNWNKQIHSLIQPKLSPLEQQRISIFFHVTALQILEVNYHHSLTYSFLQSKYPQCLQVFLLLGHSFPDHVTMWLDSCTHTVVCEWCFEVQSTDIWHMVLKICSNQDGILILEFGSLSPNTNDFRF